MIARYSIYILLFFLTSCGFGKKDHNWESSLFSSDGKYFAYTYITTTSLSAGYGRKQSGFFKYYLQIIDLATEEKLLSEPLKLEGYNTIIGFEDNYVWIRNTNSSTSISTPIPFDLSTKKLVLKGKDIIKQNSPLFDQSISSFYRSAIRNQILVEANDGRKHRLDPKTGKATLNENSFIKLENPRSDCYQVEKTIAGFSIKGDSRKKIKGKDLSNNEINSDDDFIQPSIIIIETNGDSNSIDFKDKILVLSDKAMNSSKDRIITMLDKNTLETLWSIEVPQSEQSGMSYSKERFYRNKHFLWISNSTYLLKIDLDKGNIVKQIDLYQE